MYILIYYNIYKIYAFTVWGHSLFRFGLSHRILRIMHRHFILYISTHYVNDIVKQMCLRSLDILQTNKNISTIKKIAKLLFWSVRTSWHRKCVSESTPPQRLSSDRRGALLLQERSVERVCRICQLSSELYGVFMLCAKLWLKFGQFSKRTV